MTETFIVGNNGYTVVPLGNMFEVREGGSKIGEFATKALARQFIFEHAQRHVTAWIARLNSELANFKKIDEMLGDDPFNLGRFRL